MDNQKELREELQEEQQAGTEQQKEKKETGKQRGRKRLIAALLLLLVLAAGGAAAFWYYGQDGGKEGWQEVLHGDKTKAQKSAEQKAQPCAVWCIRRWCAWTAQKKQRNAWQKTLRLIRRQNRQR